MTDVSPHGDEAETAEAKKIIDMERMMEEEGVKCFVVMAAEAPLGGRVSRAVQVLTPELGAESDKDLFPESCLQDDATDDYAKSEAFESGYRAVTDHEYQHKWPEGLTEEDGKLYRNGRLLVPESRVLELCEAWHHYIMHQGVGKQVLDMQRLLEIDKIGLYNVIRLVKKGCSVCQACNPDRLIGVSGEKPNGRRFLTSPWRVWPWMFSPCPKYISEERFWIVFSYLWIDTVATLWPSLGAKRGCLPRIRHWLTVFGVPHTICRNRGLQFNGGCFKATFSHMGKRHAKSVAYLSRSNGRAEVAGAQLFEKLRKIRLTNKRRKWFEEMWPALKAHHDTPTPGAWSPHQINLGGDALRWGLPLSGEGMAMDAKDFFAQQETTAPEICLQFKEEHAVRAKTAQKLAAHGLWVLTAPKPGSHPESWFAALVNTPTASRGAPDSSGSDMKVNSVPVSLMFMGNMCLWSTPRMMPTWTATMLSTVDTVRVEHQTMPRSG